MKRMLYASAMVGVCLSMACASTNVRTVRTDISGPLPRPDRVLVYDLAVSPEEVKLDRGISAKAIAAAQGSSRTEQEIATGRAVAQALSEHLVKEIRKLGFDAERGTGSPQQSGNDLAIDGHFLSIDEGNRTARVVIGIGAGRTDVQAEVQVYQNGLVVEQLQTDAKSGAKPGMAETMGAGAAAGRLGTSAVISAGVAGASEAFGANVESRRISTAPAWWSRPRRGRCAPPASTSGPSPSKPVFAPCCARRSPRPSATR